MARAVEYDAIMLDVMLPGCDGLEVCRRLRDGHVWTPVLMLTARDTVHDRVAGLDVGADDYLPKPFAFEELLARLRALARRSVGERPVVVEVGDLRLDPVTREVWRGETPISLSAKEFALLETFMRRPGYVLSRDQLLEHGWDHAYEARSNVVDVYVGYLRDKIAVRSAVAASRRCAAWGTGFRRAGEPASAPHAPHARVRARDGGRARSGRGLVVRAARRRARRAGRRRPRGARGNARAARPRQQRDAVERGTRNGGRRRARSGAHSGWCAARVVACPAPTAPRRAGARSGAREADAHGGQRGELVRRSGSPGCGPAQSSSPTAPSSSSSERRWRIARRRSAACSLSLRSLARSRSSRPPWADTSSRVQPWRPSRRCGARRVS